MSKRIVIIPNFGESHFIKCQIPNLVETINPDIVIYNEGLFPTGPESKTDINQSFRSKYCIENTNLAWDTLETQLLIFEANKKYHNTKWIYNEMKFNPNMNASEAYTYAVSNFNELGITVNPGDFIFPYEPDIFHLETDKDSISHLLNQLKEDEGFTSIWLDFLETQNYIEKCNNPWLGYKKGRKLAIRFGTMDFYKNVVSQFESQNYNLLYTTELVTYHYNWFRFDKNKELRFDQIVRQKSYWDSFRAALDEMRYNTKMGIKQDVVLRPNRGSSDPARFASYIEIEHPNAIKLHPNYINKFV